MSTLRTLLLLQSHSLGHPSRLSIDTVCRRFLRPSVRLIFTVLGQSASLVDEHLAFAYYMRDFPSTPFPTPSSRRIHIAETWALPRRTRRDPTRTAIQIAPHRRST